VSELMEWILIFFMFYIFCSAWLIAEMIEKILKLLTEMNEKK
jgi:cell division protein FtsB